MRAQRHTDLPRGAKVAAKDRRTAAQQPDKAKHKVRAPHADAARTGPPLGVSLGMCRVRLPESGKATGRRGDEVWLVGSRARRVVGAINDCVCIMYLLKGNCSSPHRDLYLGITLHPARYVRNRFDTLLYSVSPMTNPMSVDENASMNMKVRVRPLGPYGPK